MIALWILGELDTVVNFIAKQSISRLMDSNPKAVKDQLISNCANILACYRKNCASPSSMGQLILPECLKLLPLYTNCLIKSDVLSGGTDVGWVNRLPEMRFINVTHLVPLSLFPLHRCDDRAFLMNAVSSMDVASTVVYFYPRLFAIHDVSTSETGLPNQIRCSIEKIRDDGVYLLENGLYLFMYIGLAVDPSWVSCKIRLCSNLNHNCYNESCMALGPRGVWCSVAPANQSRSKSTWGEKQSSVQTSERHRGNHPIPAIPTHAIGGGASTWKVGHPVPSLSLRGSEWQW